MKHTEMIMVIEAHSEGKTIESKLKPCKEWSITESPEFNFSCCDYRVKPEPKYKISFMAPTFGGNLGGDKYVEIKALEDALYIIDIMNCSPDRGRNSFDSYAPLKELLK